MDLDLPREDVESIEYKEGVITVSVSGDTANFFKRFLSKGMVFLMADRFAEMVREALDFEESVVDVGED